MCGLWYCHVSYHPRYPSDADGRRPSPRQQIPRHHHRPALAHRIQLVAAVVPQQAIDALASVRLVVEPCSPGPARAAATGAASIAWRRRRLVKVDGKRDIACYWLLGQLIVPKGEWDRGKDKPPQ